MTIKILTAGDPIECRCTKCKEITNHTIIAMAEEKPAKVECNTCHGQHKYRKPAAARKTTTRKTADPKIAEQKEWEKLLPEMNAQNAKKYDMEAAYKVGNLVEHSTFGLGIVQTQVGPKKMAVLFQSGKKIMRCL
jgi:hypothetical protein